MMADREILAVAYASLTGLRSARTSAGGLLRYIQYRDRHENEAQVDESGSGLLRYVAYRDRTSPRGRLFGRQGRAGDAERRGLERYIRRSAQGLSPAWRRNQRGQLVDTQRVAYTFVLSPENAEGLDLRELARATMAPLEERVGATLPPWLAAVHRNTAHPHVHIVMAARREVTPGIFRTVLVTRQRLVHMKDALAREHDRQRGWIREQTLEQPSPTPNVAAPSRERQPSRQPRRQRPPRSRADQSRLRRRLRREQRSRQGRIWRSLQRAASRYRRQLERQERDRELEEREWLWD